jgi:bile acid:Na+ symporter, BASS family
MDAFLPVLQKVATLVFLVSSMIATGLTITPRAVLAPLRNVPLVLLALALNFIAAPGLAWVLAYLLRLSPGHTAGLMLLGCAAGAPFLPKLIEVARGDMALAASVMILLTAGTLLFMPLALPILVPQLPTDPWEIAKPLLMLIVAPLLLGMVVRSMAAAAAARTAPVLAKLGTLALLVLFLLLVSMNVRSLLGVIGSGAIIAAILHFFLLFALSWLLCAKSPQAQSVLALGTPARNFGAALVPAGAATGDPNVTIMLIVSAIVGLLIAFPLAKRVRGKGRLP